MMKPLVTVMFLVALLPLAGETTSRIGGGKIASARSEFTAELSLSFHEVKLPNKVFKYFTSPISSFSTSLPLGRPSLIIAELIDLYPEQASADRKEFSAYFEVLGYIDRTQEFAEDPCVTVLYRERGDTDQFILSWGQGKGFELSLSRDGATKLAGTRLVETVTLKPGACGWN